MAKAHLSLSPVLIAFLLVLVVADVGYVRGQCEVHTVDSCDGSNCDSYCVGASSFAIHHSSCVSLVLDDGFGPYISDQCTCCGS
ncbi:hypothetical protein MKW94_005933 [Papaver nudicaule]|uniref:Uncharacterized protein n=1 Tax=Papaver nudicaule TaxID=74823 RepID=A0AA41VAY5_PAPNU|nr:hypothetical protein [Papaver nudicaule]